MYGIGKVDGTQHAIAALLTAKYQLVPFTCFLTPRRAPHTIHKIVGEELHKRLEFNAQSFLTWALESLQPLISLFTLPCLLHFSLTTSFR
jgi:hypothetical protein